MNAALFAALLAGAVGILSPIVLMCGYKDAGAMCSVISLAAGLLCVTLLVFTLRMLWRAIRSRIA